MSGSGNFSPGEIERLRTVSGAAGLALWSWHLGDDELKLNGPARRLWGVADAGRITFDALTARIVPEDLDKVRTAFEPTRAAAGEFAISFRILRHGEVCWLSGRGNHGTYAGDAQVLFSIFFDVTEHERTEERRRVFTAEMDHRVKNSFAIASALTSLVARSALTPHEMAMELQLRFAALGRAQNLVRNLGQGMGHTALGELVAALLSVYDSALAHQKRIYLRMPDVRLGEAAATTLALVLHELGTNSIKYGALSVVDGTLDVAASFKHGYLVMNWTERGGPPVTAPAHGPGFGIKLIQQSMNRQLGGSAEFAWSRDGLAVTLCMNKSHVLR